VESWCQLGMLLSRKLENEYSSNQILALEYTLLKWFLYYMNTAEGERLVPESPYAPNWQVVSYDTILYEFGSTFLEELLKGFNVVSEILTRSGKDTDLYLLYAKEIVSFIFCRWSTMSFPVTSTKWNALLFLLTQ